MSNQIYRITEFRSYFSSESQLNLISAHNLHNRIQLYTYIVIYLMNYKIP